jgi:hypothetical protein
MTIFYHNCLLYDNEDKLNVNIIIIVLIQKKLNLNTYILFVEIKIYHKNNHMKAREQFCKGLKICSDTVTKKVN